MGRLQQVRNRPSSRHGLPFTNFAQRCTLIYGTSHKGWGKLCIKKSKFENKDHPSVYPKSMYQKKGSTPSPRVPKFWFKRHSFRSQCLLENLVDSLFSHIKQSSRSKKEREQVRGSEKPQHRQISNTSKNVVRAQTMKPPNDKASSSIWLRMEIEASSSTWLKLEMLYCSTSCISSLVSVPSWRARLAGTELVHRGRYWIELPLHQAQDKL